MSCLRMRKAATHWYITHRPTVHWLELGSSVMLHLVYQLGFLGNPVGFFGRPRELSLWLETITCKAETLQQTLRRRRNVPWLTKNITRHIRKRNAAFQATKRSARPKVASKYKRLRNKVVKMLRDAKSSYLK